MAETIAYSGPRIAPEKVAEGVLKTGIEPIPDSFHKKPKDGHRCACGLGIALAARFGVPTLARVGNKANNMQDPCVVFDKLGLDEHYGCAFVDGFDDFNSDFYSDFYSKLCNPVMYAGWTDGVASRIAADAAWAQLQAADKADA